MNTVTNKPSKWKTVKQVVAFLIREGQGHKRSVLMGEKCTGIIAGFIVPPGGHLETYDKSLESACRRETKAETGLKLGRGQLVAELRIRIRDKKLKIIVYNLVFHESTGKLKPDGREFKKLQFYPLTEADLPWDRFVPGDAEWIRDAVLHDKKRLVTMLCGKDRKDVLRVRLYPLSKSIRGK